MTNLKTILKQKSKLLLIILSIFRLIFSYSCSCRNDSTGPGGDSKIFKASIVGTPRDTLRVNNAGKKKEGTDDITIKFNAKKGIDEVNFDVSIEE